MDRVREVLNADCLEAMRSMGDCTFDAVVTDPPYGLSFMGKGWDTFGANGSGSPMQEWFTPVFSEILRVSKPGAHLLCFGGTRTFHRMACAIEDAGWEIRDCIMWVYGSGFPKSMDVSKAIDKELGAKRPVVGKVEKLDSYGYVGNNTYGGGPDHAGVMEITAPATSESAQWDGWGTALKPAWEPIIVARKPLDGTVAHNVLEHGTGALNIDACRVPTEDNVYTHGDGETAHRNRFVGQFNHKAIKPNRSDGQALGRFPANLVHDGSDEVMALFPDDAGGSSREAAGEKTKNCYGKFATSNAFVAYDGHGSAARFFYCAKASASERGAGNDHPTVKPNELMRWLVRLVCRQGGTVLDPFCGSGSTGVACVNEGMSFVGIDQDEHYCGIARRRIEDALPHQQRLF